MLLRDFLLKNATDLIDQIFDWTFRTRKFHLRVISDTVIQYKEPRDTTWNNLKIESMREFVFISVKVHRKTISERPMLVIETNDPD